MAEHQPHDQTAGVPIQMINKTTAPHTVLMFGLDHSIPLSLTEVEMAWQIIDLGPNGRASVLYPEESAIGAYYTKSNGTTVTLGPFASKPGSKWIVDLQSADDDGQLSLDISAATNTHGYFVVENKVPTEWSGRRVSVGLYKGGKPLVVKADLRVGDYVELKPTNKLFVCNMELPSPTSQLGFDIADIFKNLQIRKRDSSDEIDFHVVEFSQLSEIDLNDYMNTGHGVDILLDENQFSGQVTFTVKPRNI